MQNLSACYAWTWKESGCHLPTMSYSGALTRSNVYNPHVNASAVLGVIIWFSREQSDAGVCYYDFVIISLTTKGHEVIDIIMTLPSSMVCAKQWRRRCGEITWHKHCTRKILWVTSQTWLSNVLLTAKCPRISSEFTGYSVAQSPISEVRVLHCSGVTPSSTSQLSFLPIK